MRRGFEINPRGNKYVPHSAKSKGGYIKPKENEKYLNEYKFRDSFMIKSRHVGRQDLELPSLGVGGNNIEGAVSLYVLDPNDTTFKREGRPQRVIRRDVTGRDLQRETVEGLVYISGQLVANGIASGERMRLANQMFHQLSMRLQGIVAGQQFLAEGQSDLARGLSQGQFDLAQGQQGIARGLAQGQAGLLQELVEGFREMKHGAYNFQAIGQDELDNAIRNAPDAKTRSDLLDLKKENKHNVGQALTEIATELKEESQELEAERVNIGTIIDKLKIRERELKEADIQHDFLEGLNEELEQKVNELTEANKTLYNDNVNILSQARLESREEKINAMIRIEDLKIKLNRNRQEFEDELEYMLNILSDGNREGAKDQETIADLKTEIEVYQQLSRDDQKAAEDAMEEIARASAPRTFEELGIPRAVTQAQWLRLRNMPYGINGETYQDVIIKFMMDKHKATGLPYTGVLDVRGISIGQVINRMERKDAQQPRYLVIESLQVLTPQAMVREHPQLKDEADRDLWQPTPEQQQQGNGKAGKSYHRISGAGESFNSTSHLYRR